MKFPENWRPPKWSPELVQFLSKKILTDWSPAFGNQIHCSLVKHPTCIGIVKGVLDAPVYCSSPIVWWHPITRRAYCDNCIGPLVTEGFGEMWYKIKLFEMHDRIVAMGINL